MKNFRRIVSIIVTGAFLTSSAQLSSAQLTTTPSSQLEIQLNFVHLGVSSPLAVEPAAYRFASRIPRPSQRQVIWGTVVVLAISLLLGWPIKDYYLRRCIEFENECNDYLRQLTQRDERRRYLDALFIKYPWFLRNVFENVRRLNGNELEIYLNREIENADAEASDEPLLTLAYNLCLLKDRDWAETGQAAIIRKSYERLCQRVLRRVEEKRATYSEEQRYDAEVIFRVRLSSWKISYPFLGEFPWTQFRCIPQFSPELKEVIAGSREWDNSLVKEVRALPAARLAGFRALLAVVVNEGNALWHDSSELRDPVDYNDRRIKLIYLKEDIEKEINDIPPGSGHMGRKGKNVSNAQAKMDIWEKGSKPVVNPSVSEKIAQAVKFAQERLAPVVASGKKGPSVTLAKLALRRLEKLPVGAIRVHVESDVKGEHDQDLFLLGQGNGSKIQVPVDLVNEATDEQGIGKLARAIVHEATEGLETDGDWHAILVEHPSLAQGAKNDGEDRHRAIIKHLEGVYFAEFDLGTESRQIIASQLEENKALDAVSIQAITDEGKGRAAGTLAAKVLEFGKSEEEVQAAVNKTFANGEALDTKQVGAHLLLPSDKQSPLAAQIEKIDAKALIVLDAAVLEDLAALPAGLNQAIKNGRVVFFGTKNHPDVDAAYFVDSETAIKARVDAAKENPIEKVVTLLAPEKMRAFSGSYGKRAIAGKAGFVAPLNRNHSIPVHVAFANELIRVNFNVADLSEAGKLLLALQLETIDVSIAEMQDILYELGQIPSEIVRDGKKGLQEGIIQAVLQELAA